jgi:hypothetical protein
MATRNLTEAFIIMRNNALQTKHIYAEQVNLLKNNIVFILNYDTTHYLLIRTL